MFRIIRKIWLSILILASVNLNLPAVDINELIRENDPVLKQKREEWIRGMHKCETGVDWRIIEEQNRLSKLLIQEASPGNQGSKRKSDKTAGFTESIAGGKIIGEWIEKGSNNQAGRVMTADIDFDKEMIYLISAGGNIWKGPLKGNNWTCLNDRLKFSGSLIRLLDIGQQSSKRILVAETRSVMYSDDDGETWHTAGGMDNVKNWGDIRRAIVLNDEANTIFVISNEWDYTNWHSISVLYKSVDKGSNFTVTRKFDKYENRLDMWAPRYAAKEAYMIHENALYTLDSGGIQSKYTDCTFEPPGGDLSRVTFLLQGSFNDNGNYLHLVMRIGSEPSEHFYISGDMGKTWTKKSTLDFGPFTSNSFRVSTLDENLMFYGGVELYYTLDGGINWKKMNGWGEYYLSPEKKLHADIPSVDIFRTPDGEEIYLISTDGGLYISDDYLSTVRNLSIGSLNVSQYYDVLTSELKPEVVFAGSQDQGFQRCTNDSGKTLGFTQTISGDYGHLTSSDGGYTLWTVYPGFAMVYTNATGDYKTNSWSFKDNNYWLWMPHIIALPDNPFEAYIAAGGKDASYLWKLKLGSNMLIDSTYAFDFSAASGGGKLSSIGVPDINPGYIYALTDNGKYFVSSDKGKNWESNQDFAGPQGHYFYGASVLPSKIQSGKLFIAGSGYNNHSVYLSEDHGKTFIPADSGLPATLIYGIAMSEDEKLLFAATEAGPFVYIAEDSVWYDLSGYSAPDQLYWSVEYVPSKKSARFGTYGRGIWDFRVDEIHTGVNNSTLIVPKLNLSISPVPFVNNLTIEAISDRNTNGSIKIFDIEGRLITTIFSGEIGYGNNCFTWNGLSFSGTKIPDGTYLIVFSAGGNSTYKKIVKE